KGQEMLRRRNGERRIAPECFVVDQGLILSCEHRVACGGLKATGPVIRLRHMTAPAVGVQVMNQIAAADDQDFFITERGQSLAQRMVKGSWLRLINAQLHDWNVRIREYVTQYGPSAMVQTPVQVFGDHRRGDQCLDAPRKLRTSRRRVLRSIEL